MSKVIRNPVQTDKCFVIWHKPGGFVTFAGIHLTGMNTGRNLLLFFLFLLACLHLAAQQNDSVDSLIKAHPAEDTAKVNLLNRIAFSLRNSDAVRGQEIARTALQIATRLQYRAGEATSHSHLGVLHYKLAEYDKASEEHFKALGIRETSGDSVGIMKSYLNIGNVFSEQGNSDQALRYYELSVGLMERLDQKTFLSDGYTNIGTIYFDKKNYAEAQRYFSKAIDLAAAENDDESRALAINNVGNVLREMGQYDSALVYFSEALQINEAASVKVEMANVYNAIGDVYRLQKKFNEAFEYIAKAETLSWEISFREGREEVYKSYAETWRDKGDAVKALDYFEKYLALHDSLIGENNAQKVNDADKRFQAEKQRRQTLLAEQHLKETETENQRKSFINTMLLAVSALLLVLLVIIFLALRTKQKHNSELAIQKEELVRSRESLRSIHKDITDSLQYSRRIQDAMLPSAENMKRLLPESFVFYRPRDIVSGDFFWADEWGSVVLVAVVDCTGHGVPGALLSILGHNLLSQAVQVHGLSRPHLILNAVNKGLARTLRQNSGTSAVNDGMDMTLIAIDRKKKIIEYAGANNPLWIVRRGKLIEIRPDRRSLGSIGGAEESFTVHTIPVEDDDQLYMFSDGYADQFGGEAAVRSAGGKKMKYARLKTLLTDNSGYSVAQQRDELEKFFDAWKGDLQQVDDVLVMGIKL